MISGYTYFLVGVFIGIIFCMIIPNLPITLRNLFDKILKYKKQLDEQKKVEGKKNKKEVVNKKWEDLNIEFYN